MKANPAIPFLLVLLAVRPATTQVSFGAKVGTPITDNFRVDNLEPQAHFSLYESDTKRYTVGPTVEIGLPRNFAVEFDVLYRRLGYERRGFVPGLNTLDATTGNSWQFPFLLKYNWGRNGGSPFVDAGVSFHRVNASTRHTLLGDPFGTGMPDFTGPPGDARELVHEFRTGGVLGVGWNIPARFIRFSPELRYTRWSSESFVGQVLESNVLRSNRNQLDFLLGITF